MPDELEVTVDHDEGRVEIRWFPTPTLTDRVCSFLRAMAGAPVRQPPRCDPATPRFRPGSSEDTNPR